MHNAISELRLHQFRNHFAFHWLGESAPVVVTGLNGAGKTNILEAISFLAPGKGLRSAKLNEVNRWGAEDPWAIYALAQTPVGEVTIGTARAEGANGDKRIIKVDGEVLKAAGQIKNHIGLLMLTPTHDRVFMDGASSRREFLDHLVSGFDNAHAKRISAYDQLRSERLKLITTYGGYDAVWAKALEARMAESAIAIAAARIEALTRIAEALASHTNSAFPRPYVAVDGSVERDLGQLPALQAEEAFQARLAQARDTDALTGRTQDGTHRADFRVQFMGVHNQPAESCSTGEQKALLLSLILATARARAAWHGAAPILLFDEVVAHLDPRRRAALAEEIKAMGAQIWMTGTEPEAFHDFLPFSQHLVVEPPIEPKMSYEESQRLDANRD